MCLRARVSSYQTICFPLLYYQILYMGVSENSVSHNPMDYHHVPHENCYLWVSPIFRQTHIHVHAWRAAWTMGSIFDLKLAHCAKLARSWAEHFSLAGLLLVVNLYIYPLVN